MLSTKLNIVFILFLNRPLISADPLPIECGSEMTFTDCTGGEYNKLLPTICTA